MTPEHAPLNDHTAAALRTTLEERGLRPKRSLGQNFLIDHNMLRKLLGAAPRRDSELVLEVGPGAGVLTRALLDRGDRVIACELDDALADLLEDRFAGDIARGELTLIRGDCLRNKRELSPALAGAIGDNACSLIANLPYGAATPLMLTLMTSWPRCSRIAVTVQSEVADRLLAREGSKTYGLVSVVRSATMTGKRIATLPGSCFWPPPKVASAMILLARRDAPLTDDVAGLAETASRVFANRRKQLGSTLRNTGEWPAGVDPTMRAEQLTPEQIVAIHNILSAP